MFRTSFPHSSMLFWADANPDATEDEFCDATFKLYTELRIGLKHNKQHGVLESAAMETWRDNGFRGERPKCAEQAELESLGEQPPSAWMPDSIPPPSEYYEDWGDLTMEQRLERTGDYIVAFEAAMVLPPYKEWLRAPIKGDEKYLPAAPNRPQPDLPKPSRAA